MVYWIKYGFSVEQNFMLIPYYVFDKTKIMILFTIYWLIPKTD